MTREQIAKYFRYHAEIQDLSQAEIARRSGVHKDDVNKLFNGRGDTGRFVRDKVANVLGLVVSDVFIPDIVKGDEHHPEQ